MAGHFARALGYAPVETVFVYSDMTARDLLQRRATGERASVSRYRATTPCMIHTVHVWRIFLTGRGALSRVCNAHRSCRVHFRLMVLPPYIR
jgi:hypothetical protein